MEEVVVSLEVLFRNFPRGTEEKLSLWAKMWTPKLPSKKEQRPALDNYILLLSAIINLSAQRYEQYTVYSLSILLWQGV
jgi:hypothetical protein